jgi:iron-sulfur cluster assembly protein
MSETVTIINIDTGIEGAEEMDTFNVSERALEMILKVKKENSIEDNQVLRIGAQSGGCSGMQYALGFDDKTTDQDNFYTAKDLKLVIDRTTIFYLMGVTLDFTEGPQGNGFVFQNPNNFNTCGCSA